MKKNKQPKVAIYHFTNKSEKRPSIYKKEVNKLVEYAKSRGYTDINVFCDKSKKRYERTRFDEFLSSCEQYDLLITKDFYHISKNIGTCIDIIQGLKEKGVEVCSMVNGSFEFADVPLNKPLKVATYTCHFGVPREEKDYIRLNNDIFKLFCDKKTAWTIVDQFYDESFRQNDGEQRQLLELLRNRSKYDLLLLNKFVDFNLRTANFCKLRNQLGLDIYALQEGFLNKDKRRNQ